MLGKLSNVKEKVYKRKGENVANKKLDYTVQEQQILYGSLNGFTKWANSTNTLLQDILKQLNILRNADVAHEALFRCLQESDSRVQKILDALGAASKPAEPAK